MEGGRSRTHRGRVQPAPSTVVDFDELCRLTGRTKPTYVSKWLQSKGILYWLNADNRPVTTERALNEALMRGRTTRPDFSELRRTT